MDRGIKTLTELLGPVVVGNPTMMLTSSMSKTQPNDSGSSKTIQSFASYVSHETSDKKMIVPHAPLACSLECGQDSLNMPMLHVQSTSGQVTAVQTKLHDVKSQHGIHTPNQSVSLVHDIVDTLASHYTILPDKSCTNQGRKKLY